MITPYQSPLLYLVRHGATQANEKNHFRGHLDYPLDDDGLKAAEEAAYYLSFRPIAFMASSTLQRAVQTAQIIAPAVQMESAGFDRNPNLLPWNIGDFAGKPKSKFQSDLDHYINNPDEVIPNGESLSEFRRRVADIIYRYVAQASYQQPGVLVLHSSVLKATAQVLAEEAEAQGKKQDENLFEMDQDIVEPGGIVGLYSTPDNLCELQPLLGQIITDPTVS